MRLPGPLALTLCLALAGCSADGEDRRTIVASVYPLAFAAQELAGSEWEVIDLTPPGVEAHDLELTLEQRADIEEADIVFYLGDIGFQPQVERAVLEADGDVIDFEMYSRTGEGVRDAHVWLDPAKFGSITEIIGGALCPAEKPCLREDGGMRDDFRFRVFELGRSYESGLSECRFETAIVTHEAFGYLSDYFDQFGLSGNTPEAEPSARRIAEAHRLIEEGEAGAVFYDEHEDAQQVAESFASDADVPALPLSTLESRPESGDYFSVMQANLQSLREGLRCR